MARLDQVSTTIPPPPLKLTGRQWRFCHAMARNPDDPRGAAIAAGYSEKSAEFDASEMLKKPKIQAGLLQVQEDLADSARLDGDFVRAKIAWALEQIPGEGGGPSWQSWISILILAARCTGLIMPGERTTNNILAVSTGMRGDLQRLSDAELRAIASGTADSPAPREDESQGAEPR